MNETKISSSFDNTVNDFASLPGIGRKTAQRLVLKLLNRSKEDLVSFGENILTLSEKTNHCKNCFNLTEDKKCTICLDESRAKNIICVVEHVLDLVSVENTKIFKGLYHVLGGVISPMEGVAPSDINIQALVDRVKSNKIEEVIFALSTTMEGDATNFYIFKKLAPLNIKITAIAKGVGIGSELEYTDEVTLNRSIQNRLPFEISISQ